MTDRCQRLQCGRKLTDPNSQLLGYGPVCYRKQFGRPAPLKDGAPVGPIALFDVPDAPVKPLGRDARRTLRQAQEIARGFHPLGVALRIFLPLHPDAPRGDDRKAPGPRCGTCVHRVVPLREVSGTYPKCNYTSSGRAWERATGGPGTDCRAWWPACHTYQPKEPTNVLKIYGAGDDTILVDGAIKAEIYVTSTGHNGALLVTSNGVVLRIRHQTCWRIDLITGRDLVQIVPCPEDDEDNYSDVATIPGDVDWVVCRDTFVTD